jgi:predicted ATPase/DNA-binding CsgD family transcriptional regulator
MNDRPDHRTHLSGEREWGRSAQSADPQSAAPGSTLQTIIPLHDYQMPAGTNLPRRLTSFVGRELELRAVRTLIVREDVPLVTLTGPGGVGKTRLALQSAETLDHVFPDGMWFVDLAPIMNPALVLPAIAKVLGVRETRNEAMLDGLAAYLARRRVLLILDNFERVADAAQGIAELLAVCPELKVIVTSRVSLHLSAEHLFPVPPLVLPDDTIDQSLANVAAAEAVRLFVTRAKAAIPEFELTETNASAVSAICRRVDGLPLAIELTAARITLLPPSALLARLDRRLKLLTGGVQDHPARLRTMRDAIAWSYDFMTPDQQRLFRRLAVFAGFPLEAVTAISADWPRESGGEDAGKSSYVGSGDRDLVLEGVAALVDQSVIKRVDHPGESPRFAMLETIREFGLEQLEASGEAEEVRERHVAWCLSLVQAAENERIGLSSSAHAERLDLNRDNVKAALLWLRDRGQLVQALQMASSLWPMWLERSDMSEGRAILASLLALPGASANKEVWAKAMCVIGALAQAMGDHDEAADLSRRALTIFRDLGDARGQAFALSTLGLDAMLLGNYEQSEQLLRESLNLFRSVGDPRAGGWAMRHLSSLAYRHGDVAGAASMASEGLVLVRQSANRLDIARLLLNISLMAVVQHQLDRAQALSQKALLLFREEGDRWGEADALIRLGRVSQERGDFAEASAYLDASLALFQDVGDPEGTAVALAHLGWVKRAQGAQPAATECFTESLALCRDRHQPSCVAWALLGQGALALDKSDHDAAAAAWQECLRVATGLEDRLIIATALEWCAHFGGPEQATAIARLLGAAAALRDELGVPLGSSLDTDHDLIVSRLRSRLGDADFDTAFEKGRGMPLRDAIALSASLLASSAPEAGMDLPARSYLPAMGIDQHLTPRELQVLKLIAEGMPDREIAETLYISRRTVSHHVSVILSKLGVTSRVGAATCAIRAGLV